MPKHDPAAGAVSVCVSILVARYFLAMVRPAVVSAWRLPQEELSIDSGINAHDVALAAVGRGNALVRATKGAGGQKPPTNRPTNLFHPTKTPRPHIVRLARRACEPT